MSATLTPTEDQTFDALFGYIARCLGLPDDTQDIVKGFQNLVASPVGSFVVVSPGILQRHDFGRWEYDPAGMATTVVAHNTYSYQLDCYGPEGATRASILAAAWRSMWGATVMQGAAITPLYADAPQYLSIVNSEGQYEARWMIRLFGQVNQNVSLPQDYFTAARLDGIVVADQLP